MPVAEQSPARARSSFRALRIADLPQRVERDRDTAAAEAQNADYALQTTFKHADALTAAHERVGQIAVAMQQRQHSAPGEGTADGRVAAPEADEDLGALQRLTRADFPMAPGSASGVRSSNHPPESAPPFSVPSRSNGPER